MKFEHLIRINDLDNPNLPVISRQQLWAGMVRRAEMPQEFVLGLEAARIIERGEGWFRRELDFGRLQVVDTVHLLEQLEVRYVVLRSAQVPGGVLSHRIEEPSAGELFLRFSYDTEQPEYDADGTHVGPFLKQAYSQADMDTVRRIMELAVEGLLD